MVRITEIRQLKRKENNNYWKQRNKKNNWNKVELEFIMINMLRISFILH